jgi:hypothetical protein
LLLLSPLLVGYMPLALFGVLMQPFRYCWIKKALNQKFFQVASVWTSSGAGVYVFLPADDAQFAFCQSSFSFTLLEQCLVWMSIHQHTRKKN